MKCSNCGQKIVVRKIISACACDVFDTRDLDDGFAPLAGDLPRTWKPNRVAIANAITRKLIANQQGNATVSFSEIC